MKKRYVLGYSKDEIWTSLGFGYCFPLKNKKEAHELSKKFQKGIKIYQLIEVKHKKRK